MSSGCATWGATLTANHLGAGGSLPVGAKTPSVSEGVDPATCLANTEAASFSRMLASMVSPSCGKGA